MKPLWTKLNIKNIDISGIHLDILKRQANGLTGHIDEVFPDLSNESAWLGGSGEAWERGPYYIDGLIPLAYLLRDDSLLAKANHWITSIIESQDESGFFGPRQNLDWWPRAVVLKALVSQYLATQNKETLKFIKRYLEYMTKNIDRLPFEFWGYARGMEGKEVLDLLVQNNINMDTCEIEDKWKENTLDWSGFFNDFPYQKPTHHYLNKHLFKALKPILAYLDSLEKKRKTPKIKSREKILADRSSRSKYLYLTTHGVNLAMAFKYLMYWQGDTSDMFKALDTVNKHHGNALSLFSSDEHLNGYGPETGIELCTVVEMMYTMEEAIRLTGNFKAADYLETYAYNALLTTINQEFTAHQYVQQVNQSDCEVRHHGFYDTDKYGNTFGVEPNFGCCAANMHQGWPKMMLSAVMRSEEGLGIFLYVNGKYKVDFEDGSNTLEISTNYPFSDEVRIKCLASTVKQNKKWILRIPFMCDATLTMKGIKKTLSNTHQVEIDGLTDGECIDLKFDFKTITLDNPDGTISVKRGPLVYALPIDHQEFHIKGESPFHDRGYTPKERPNVSVVLKNGNVNVLEFKQSTDKNDFFKNQTSMKILGFDLDKDQETELNLLPYGMTILRKTHFTRRKQDEKQQ